jgi:Flp pilus assembly pilin Flp
VRRTGVRQPDRRKIVQANFVRSLTIRSGEFLGMPSINNMTASLAGDRRAVTALEYGIIAGVFGLVLILIFQNFGSTLSTLMSTIGKSI